MRKTVELVCTLIGGVAVLASVAMLFFARLLPMLWIVGGVTLLVGFGLFSIARSGRTWPARGVLGVLVLAVLGLCQTAPQWVAYVQAGSGGSGSNVEPSVEAPANPDDAPVVQVAEGSGTKANSANAKAAAEGDENEITLEQLLNDHIEPALKAISAKKGYTCTFQKREWCKGLIGGLRLTDERCQMKVRHEPFSAYLRFEQPTNKDGTEAIYVEGKNNGNVIAHSTTFAGRLIGTIRVPPTDPKVMADNRYPITNIGMRNLLLKIQKQGKEFEEELKGFAFTLVGERKKIDGRPCTCIEFYNPKPSARVPMVSARLYLDQEWKVPVGFESYENRGGRAELVEYYRYTKIKFDPEFNDLDFDPSNPKYGYK
jgi:hypothetical protein